MDKHFGLNAYKARYLVDKPHCGMRLDRFLQIYLREFSRETIKEKIKNGEVTIKERSGSIRASTKIKQSDIIEMVIYKTEHEDEYWSNKKLDISAKPEILFEDDNLIVISKPPFMAAHPTGRHLFYCATVYFESIYKHTIHPIHRLDRETSGILLLAKNSSTAKNLGYLFENEKVFKCYFFISLVDTQAFKGEDFIADERLGQESGLDRMTIRHYRQDSKQGKKALTKFYILMRDQKYVVGLAFPKTGRQHQIRVHALAHGLPLLGDKLYLGGIGVFQRFKERKATEEDHRLLEIPRHALHATAIKIAYGKIGFFRCNLPMDLKKWLKNKTKFDIKKLQKKMDDKIKMNFQ
ncbi:MAG: RluA family pseudouridine synthase [Halobacteriovoraceae bacterium]|nr:RluA family pseudouridine synthase [Halobacteriovoraceae bacterium]